MSRVSTVEDALIAEATQLLQGTVKSVEWGPPGPWSEEDVKRILKNAMPGVLVVFLGGDNRNQGGESVQLDSAWAIVAVTRHVQEPKARARGDAREIGAYDILETLIPGIHGLTIDGIGTIEFVAWDNEFAQKFESNALMIQSATFGLSLALDRTVDPSALHPFERFHGTFDIGQPAGAPSTEVMIELPQE